MRVRACVCARSVCLSVCTALVILDPAAEDVHIIQMIKTKVTIQLIPVFIAALSGFASCGYVCVCVRVFELTSRLVCLHRFSYFGC